MFDLLAHMYAQGRIDQAGLDTAVTRGWVSQTQADGIVAAGGNVGVFAPPPAPEEPAP